MRQPLPLSTRNGLLLVFMAMDRLAIAQNDSGGHLRTGSEASNGLSDQWWFYGVVLLVAVIIFLGVVRRRGGKN